MFLLIPSFLVQLENLKDKPPISAEQKNAETQDDRDKEPGSESRRIK